jgi:hypothetical protein
MAVFPTCGPGHRYGAILFVEKEGFLPLFRAVRLAERYDLAIMSTKGLSVTASRLLVDQLCAAHDVPLLVLDDFDKSGFSILGTLRRDTRRYAFRNRIEVVDLGLRLEDVEDSGLETEDVVHRSDPAPNLRENGATTEEIAFLGNRRVELNAFASADFIAWIERKLEQHGVVKIVPDESALTMAYRRSVASRYVASRLQSANHEAQRHAAGAPVPDDLADLVALGLRGDPTQSWDEVVQRLAMQRMGRDDAYLHGHLGRHQATPLDPEAEKRAGWRRHGILVVAEQDPRLSWPERELVRQLGLRLYGRQSGGGR